MCSNNDSSLGSPSMRDSIDGPHYTLQWALVRDARPTIDPRLFFQGKSADLSRFFPFCTENTQVFLPRFDSCWTRRPGTSIYLVEDDGPLSAAADVEIIFDGGGGGRIGFGRIQQRLLMRLLLLLLLSMATTMRLVDVHGL